MLVPRFFRNILLGFVGFFLVGCSGGGQWATEYANLIDPNVSNNWRVANIDVRVPETLSVSEANLFAPNADIVWREEALGNRYQQVDRIVTEAAQFGGAQLQGAKAVNLVIQVSEFHALSQKTRANLQNSGVHNITFSAQVFDAKTGAELTPVDTIRADLVAFSGAQAVEAVKQGQTQRVRIVAHLSRVFAGWLGQGPDVRTTFSRNGR